MDKRKFIAALGLAIFAAPLAAEAQQAKKGHRIGILLIGPPELPPARALLDAFRQGLRDLGYVESHSVAIEYRSAEGKLERLPKLAAELVGLKVDVIMTVGGTPAAQAAKQATNTIPIVVAAMGDPVEDGLAASLARPGGNVTGSTFLALVFCFRDVLETAWRPVGSRAWDADCGLEGAFLRFSPGCVRSHRNARDSFDHRGGQ
jgi:putative ABC transport system substrate-binding protein